MNFNTKKYKKKNGFLSIATTQFANKHEKKMYKRILAKFHNVVSLNDRAYSMYEKIFVFLFPLYFDIVSSPRHILIQINNDVFLKINAFRNFYFF